MTINIPTKTKSSMLVFHHVQDDVKGYLFNVSGNVAFVAEEDADKLARYMLFTGQEDSTENTDV